MAIYGQSLRKSTEDNRNAYKTKGDLTIHGVHRLEGHDFGSCGVSLLQQLSQVSRVIVTEDKLLGAAGPYALDHRGVVACIRVDLATLE